MQIHELPTGTIGNTDKLAYDTGKHTYAVPYSEIKNGIITEAEGKACVFTEATTRANIDTGETRATIFGKIKKWFTDINPFIFEASDTYDLSATKPYGMTTVRAKRKGKLVCLHIAGGPCTLAVGSWQSIVTLGANYKPTYQTNYVVSVPQTQTSAPILVRVTTGGVLQMEPTLNAPTGYLDIDYWYFID